MQDKESALNDPENKVRLDTLKKHFKLFHRLRKSKNQLC